MNIVTIKVKCCESDKEAVMTMNRDGLLHWRCVYCGFELHAGGEYHVKWTPHHGTEVSDRPLTPRERYMAADPEMYRDELRASENRKQRAMAAAYDPKQIPELREPKQIEWRVFRGCFHDAAARYCPSGGTCTAGGRI
jgi:hypothetical protein